MLKRIFQIIGLFILILGVGIWWVSRPPVAPARFIMTGGEIITMDALQSRVEAVLVEQGIITATGALADVQARAGEVAVINLEGHVLTPGLIEPHTHPIAAATIGAAVDVSGFTHTNRASVMATLQEAADSFALTPWLIAAGWDPVAVADLDSPTLAELDAISPERPMIILTQMLHEAYANSAAMAAAGIKPVDKNDPHHGVLRDEDGRATGTFREVSAIFLLMGASPSPPDAVLELLLRRQYDTYARAGYTTIGITGAVGRHADPVGLVKSIAASPDSPLRTYLYLVEAQLGRLPLGGDDNFRILGAKFWVDGSPFAGGAAVAESYEVTPLTQKRLGLSHSHSGAFIQPDDAAFFQQIAELHGEGYQIAMHVQGELAVERALDAIEAARKLHPEVKAQHRLEHNALITTEQMARAASMEMSLGFFVDHIYYYGDQLDDLFGEARRNRYMPVKSGFDAGTFPTLHGDHPATPVDPLRTMRTAIMRRSRSGDTISAPTEAISSEQAFAAMTINAARQLGQADKIGSISVGKLADFTVFSGNPLEEGDAPVEVLETWRSGRPVHTGTASWLKPSLVWSVLVDIVFGG